MENLVDGNIRIDGNFKGEIEGDADLTIGEGFNRGFNQVGILFDREVHGNVICSGKLEIHNTGISG